MQSAKAGYGNYLVATIHWWANNMKKKNENKPIYANRITTLLYFTFERVPVVYYANPYWNSYTSKDN